LVKRMCACLINREETSLVRYIETIGAALEVAAVAGCARRCMTSREWQEFDRALDELDIKLK